METLLYILMHLCLLEAGEKDTRHDKNHMSGSAARQGCTSTPDECSRWPGYR